MTAEAAISAGKAVGAAGIVVLSCWFAGRAVLGRLASVRSQLTALELNLFAGALGAAVVSQVVFVCGVLGLIYDAVFVLLAFIAAAAWFRWGRVAGRVATSGGSPNDRRSSGWWLMLPAAAFLFLLYAPNVLAPETGADAVRYHLGLVFHYYREHSIPTLTSSIYAFLSQGVEMLYLFAFAFGRHDAPKLVHFAMFGATVAALPPLGRRMGFPVAAWTAAALYSLTSVVATDAVTAYNDCALGFFLLMLFYALVVRRQEGGRGWPLVIGALAGFCVAVKLTAVFAAAGAAVEVAFSRNRRAFVRFALVAAFFSLSWPARNLAIAGNPAAPFLNRYFPNPHVGVRWEQDFREYFKLYRWPRELRGVTDYLELPLEAAVRGVRHGGVIGPVILALPLLALVGWRRKWTPALLTASALALFPYLSNSGTRFLIPGLPLACLAGALAVERLRVGWRAPAGFLLVLMQAALMWPPWMHYWRGEDSFWHLEDAPWDVVTGVEGREQYLGRLVENYSMMQALKVKVPPRGRVFALHSVPDAYYPGEVITSHDGRLGEELAREMMMAVEQDFRPTRVTRLSWDARETFGLRLRQTASEEHSWWAIAEVELIQGEGTVGALPADTRVDSDLAYWATGRLFDGDPLTLWRTWRRLAPASLSFEWSQPRPVAGIVIRAPWGQHYPAYEIDAKSTDGEWSAVQYGLELQRLEDDIPAVKARAHEALLEEGIRAVVGKVGGGGQALLLEHIERDPSSWGLEEAWRLGGERIYRVVNTRMR